MSLISLTTTEMVNLSSTWIEPSHADHLALIAYPALAAFMTHIEQAHRGLLDLQDGGDEVRLANGEQQQGEVDFAHHDIARAIHYNLRSQALLAPDELEAQQFLDLDALLFPDGVSAVNPDHTRAVDHARQVAARLRPEHEAVLAATPTRFGNLLEHVRAWIDALERSKWPRGQGSPSRPPNPAHARTAWVLMVNTLRSLLQTLNIDDFVVSDIMTRIEVAIRVAGRRAPVNASANGIASKIGDDSVYDRTDEHFTVPVSDLDDADLPDHVDEEQTLPGMSFVASDDDDDDGNDDNDDNDDDDGDPASTRPTRQLVVQPGRLPRVLPLPLSALRHRS
jgi:hypothetical protein